MEDKSYKTAQTRKDPSAPMKYLASKGLLKRVMLDYGCGKGKDVEYYKMDAYDPYYSPEKPRKKYDTITCNYVFNVLSESNYAEVIEKMRSYLKPGGIIYIAVRRDVKKEGWTSIGTFQKTVFLDYPIVHKTSSFCIYKV